MKKTLLIGGLMASTLFSNAQQRLALYEEFSGENCNPCAALNPALWTLLSAAGNDSKVLLLKYQSPIPSAGPIYNINKVFTDNRMSYYSINFAPHGGLNGTAVGSGVNQGNISLTTQAMINAASAGTAAFTMAISNPTYNADGQTFTATVTVTSTGAATYTNLKLRFALAEELDYTMAPGTNGETSFHNVIRQMYPSADGQAIATTWTAGQVQTYTVTGSIPSYVSNASTHKFFAAFVQSDDATKTVWQAARTTDLTTLTLPAYDIATTGITGLPSALTCIAFPTTVTPTVTLKNTGLNPITSASIYTKVGATGTWSAPIAFTGNIAPGATATQAIPALQIANGGVQTVYDSVALPNTKIDYNTYDNVASASATYLSNAATAIPLTNDFETANGNWVSWQGASTTAYPIVTATSTQAIGVNASNGFAYFPSYQLPLGYNGYLIFPKTTLPTGAKAVDFYVSYIQYLNANGTTTGDKLELVYSTDCGANWTSVWSKANADLATAAPDSASWTPTQASWKLMSADITNVPDGANLALKATSGFGNNIFIDNVNVRTGSAVTAINELVTDGSLTVYPNPTSGDLNVRMDLKKSSTVTFTVYNVLGQQLSKVVTKSLNSGTSTTMLSTDGLSAGMYYLNISTDAGSVQQKFTKQ